MPVTPCWEAMKCLKYAECPAYPDRGFECWNVAGTLCRGERQGTYNEKINACRNECSYYAAVITGRSSVT